MCTRCRSHAEQPVSCQCRPPQQRHHPLSGGLCQKRYDFHSEKTPCGALATGQLDHQAKATDSLMTPCSVQLSCPFSFLFIPTLSLLPFLTDFLPQTAFFTIYLDCLTRMIESGHTYSKIFLWMFGNTAGNSIARKQRAEILVIQHCINIILCTLSLLQYISTSIKLLYVKALHKCVH